MKQASLGIWRDIHKLLPELILNTERRQRAAVEEVHCGIHQRLRGPITHPDQLGILYNTLITAAMKKGRSNILLVLHVLKAVVDYPYWACSCRSGAAGDRQITIRRLRNTLAVKYCIGSVSSLGKSRFIEGANACK